VARLTAGPNPRRVVSTGLDALLELDFAPALEPSGVIFHLSRCGSTVASRLLGSVPGVVSIVEPASINSLLEIDPDRVNEEVLIRVLRLMVRALGRIRFADDRHLVLKLSSWNVRRASLIARAFPDVPMVWMQRTPIEIVGSLIKEPAGWCQLRQIPSACRQIFGIEALDLATLDAAQFYCFALRSMLESAQSLAARVIDYAAMPGAVWSDIADVFHIGLRADDIARMRALAQFNTKLGENLLFVPDAAEKRDVAHGVAELCQTMLDPLYEQLRGRNIIPTAAPLAPIYQAINIAWIQWLNI
jgi:hypothetical protein